MPPTFSPLFRTESSFKVKNLLSMLSNAYIKMLLNLFMSSNVTGNGGVERRRAIRVSRESLKWKILKFQIFVWVQEWEDLIQSQEDSQNFGKFPFTGREKRWNFSVIEEIFKIFTVRKSLKGHVGVWNILFTFKHCEKRFHVGSVAPFVFTKDEKTKIQSSQLSVMRIFPSNLSFVFRAHSSITR